MADANQKDPLAEALIEREGVLRGARSAWEALWQSTTRLVLPDRATYTEEVTPGVERSRFILDSTAPRALELFASFIHTMMNNPAIQWFFLRLFMNKELMDNPDNKKWLEAAGRELLNQAASEATNLYQHLHVNHLDLGSIGTAVLFADLDRKGRLITRSFHLQDCVIDENEGGFVDTMFRQAFLTARQATQRFENPGRTARQNLETKEGQTEAKIRYLHCVFPIDEPGLARHLPPALQARRDEEGLFASVWVAVQDRVTVEVGTFEEFPYMVPRWVKTRGEVYGRSPATKVLPDIRMANRMKETILRGAEKLTDPPMLLPDGGLVSPVRLRAGGLTFTEGNVKPEFLIPPGGSRIEVGNQLLLDTQNAIERGFFVPLFQTEDTPVKTATQVLQEADERNRAVSPMLIRLQAELYHPLIRRLFNLMERSGLLPERPPELAGQQIDVEYVSPLTGSQRQIEGLATLRLFEGLAPWAEIDPGVFDLFEPDAVAKVVHGASGAPAELLRNRRQVQAVRQARQQQQEQAQGFQQGTETAEAAAKLIAATNKGRK